MNKIKHAAKLLKEAYIEQGLWYVCKKSFAKFLTSIRVSTLVNFSYDDFRLILFPTQLTVNIFANRFCRADDSLIIKHYLKKGNTVIDVGANIGTITLLMSRLVGNEGRVLTFEPSKRFFNYLQENIKLNRFTNIESHNLALGSCEENLFLNEDRGDDTNFFIQRVSTKEEHVPTQVRPLDSFTEDIKFIDFLKIDVEGFEEQVLSGAEKTLQKTKIIYLEFSPANLSLTGASEKNVINLLQKFNLNINVDGKLKSFKYEQNMNQHVDLIGINQEITNE
jgi:FkbM family methyltransferase